MNIRLITLALVILLFFILRPPSAAGNHRILILDTINDQGPARTKGSAILLVETESGKVLAQAQLGTGPELGLSPKRDLLAVLTYNELAGVAQDHSRLEIFQTSDLKRLQTGLLPFLGRGAYMDFPRGPSLGVSPSGTEIVFEQIQSKLNDEKPVRLPFDYLVLHFVKRELDENGMFKTSRKDETIPRCRSIGYLRLSDWPKVHIWNNHLGALEVIDLADGTVVSRLALDYDDDPLLLQLDPSFLEKPNIGELYLHLGANGRVINGGGRYAYYVPRPTRNLKAKPGLLKKIDLGVDPPKVVGQGDERQGGLWPAVAIVCEPAGAICVAVEMQSGDRIGETTSQVRIYSIGKLNLVREIKLSLASCDSLEASTDGKYLYALNRKQAKIAVVDLTSGDEVKVLDKVGKFPVFVVALPDPESKN